LLGSLQAGGHPAWADGGVHGTISQTVAREPITRCYHSSRITMRCHIGRASTGLSLAFLNSPQSISRECVSRDHRHTGRALRHWTRPRSD
jgi:hypothetical protein